VIGSLIHRHFHGAKPAALTGFGNRNEDGDGFELMP